MRKSAAAILLALFLTSAHGVAEEYSAGKDFLLKDGLPFLVRGVVYVPAYPGFLPWELAPQKKIPEKLQARIFQDLRDIKSMGANTVRFWDAPRFAYQALKEVGGLALIQTVWLDAAQPDFQDEAFKKKSKDAIAAVLDRIYSVYSREAPPPLLALLVGSELSAGSIEKTDRLHPEINHYEGEQVSAPKGATATECFLAEMADFAKAYELAHYGRMSLVSYANEIRTHRIIDTPFLDFRCFNAYSYAILDYETPEAGSKTGTIFQGWLESLKKEYPEKPLLVTETGLSVAPQAVHVGAPDYGYGGNTPAEQAVGLLQNWNDITSATPSLAGAVFHEYLDAWWKFGRKDSLEHEPGDVEEWFGLVAIEKSGNFFETHFRDSYKRLKALWNQKSQANFSPSSS